MIDILLMIGTVLCGTIGLITALLAWKIFKCPDSLWKEFQKTPYDQSYDIIRRILE